MTQRARRCASHLRRSAAHAAFEHRYRLVMIDHPGQRSGVRGDVFILTSHQLQKLRENLRAEPRERFVLRFV